VETTNNNEANNMTNPANQAQLTTRREQIVDRMQDMSDRLGTDSEHWALLSDRLEEVEYDIAVSKTVRVGRFVDGSADITVAGEYAGEVIRDMTTDYGLAERVQEYTVHLASGHAADDMHRGASFTVRHYMGGPVLPGKTARGERSRMIQWVKVNAV